MRTNTPKVYIDINKFSLAYMSLYDQKDRDEFLRGLALGIVGGDRLMGKPAPFNAGYAFGKSASDERLLRRDKCLTAAKKGYEALMKVRAERDGSL